LWDGIFKNRFKFIKEPFLSANKEPFIKTTFCEAKKFHGGPSECISVLRECTSGGYYRLE
jgi:hypothetical protein